MLSKVTLLRRPLPLMLACTAVLLAAAALAPMARAATLNLSLVISDSSPPYRQFADSFSRNLAASQPEVNIVESQAISGTHADLIVAVGMKAAELAAAQNVTPVLAVMVPDAGYRALLAQMPPQKDKRDISAIFLNQPWSRRLDFLRAALPERCRVGLLYSPDTNIDIEGLRREIARRGASLIAQPVRSQDRLFAVLESVLADSDILLAIPDGAIYSSSNIRNILLTSYRRNVPLVGVSAAYVNAGALCAIFSTPEQLAVQAGATVISFAQSGKLPAAQYPDTFVIEVNQPVARSLRIELPAQEAIRGQMDKDGNRDR